MKNDMKERARVKRYGIFGMTEYVALIPVGAGSMRVHFTGGQMSAYGVVPATFSTADPTVQWLIEQSVQFKGKRIRVLQ